jgi:hypothetical protein
VEHSNPERKKVGKMPGFLVMLFFGQKSIKVVPCMGWDADRRMCGYADMQMCGWVEMRIISLRTG